MANNLKGLLFDNKEYFWNFDNSKNVLNKYKLKTGKTKTKVFEELGSIIQITPEAVKKWFTKGNGPGEPSYVIKMAQYFNVSFQELVKERESMEELLEKLIYNRDVNFDISKNTINVMGLLNKLAADSKSGILPFSKYVELNKSIDEFEYNGIVYIDEPGDSYGKVIADMCVDSEHEDIISNYDFMIKLWASEDYDLRVNDDDEENIFICLSGDGLNIVIHDGIWYSVL